MRIFVAALLAAVTATSTMFAPAAPAEVTIVIEEGTESRIPIAIAPFTVDGDSNSDTKSLADAPAEIIESNLARSGRFDPLPRENFIDRPRELNEVNYKIWRLLKVENLVIGSVTPISGNRLEIRFRLLDVFGEKQLTGQKFTVPSTHLRKTAHQISDIIYEKLLGRRGAFDTRIAYVALENAPRRYLLQIADADGRGAKTILESPRPILSPAWSPDGKKLAYVSFEENRSMVFVQDLRDGRRKRVAAHAGINGAPAWSPDGKKLALTLSKDGNPEIYAYDFAGENLTRLTRHTAIDTEPAWSPDGGTIAFTSNRSGTPQIYRIPSGGGPAQRVTFDGKYNAGAGYSADGKSIVLITNQGGGYRVALYSAALRTVRELSAGRHDESPTFSPGGDMIMYAAKTGGRSVLAVLSADGRARQVIRTQAGAVREVDWSPLLRE